MNVTTKPLADLTDEVLVMLRRELGVVDSLRFLRQFRAGSGDYTRDRDAVERDLSIEQIFAEARCRQEAASR